MENNKIILNMLLIILLYFIICIYSIDVRIPYPKWVIMNFHEPYMKVLIYIVLYITSYYNPIISLLFTIFTIMLHTNDVLVIKKYEKNINDTGNTSNTQQQ